MMQNLKYYCECLLTKNFLRLFTTLHTIQSLLVHKKASHCSRMSKKISKDFMTSSMTFMPFIVKLFFENLMSSNILHHLKTNLNP